MIYAYNNTGTRVTATPRTTATCPGCYGPVTAKCGRLVVHHWAHVTNYDCDQWAEPVNRWHLSWQDHAPHNYREVIMGAHRADLRSPDGRVIELQHSSLPVADIEARELFYGPKMIWIWNATDATESGRLDIRPRDGYVTFRWKHPRKSLAACNRRFLLDLGNGQLLDVKKINTETPCGGWGRIMPADTVREWLRSWTDTTVTHQPTPGRKTA